MFFALRTKYSNSLLLALCKNVSVASAMSLCYYRHLLVRSGEHIGISPSTNKKGNHTPSIDNFSVLAHMWIILFFLLIKETLLIKRDKTRLNKSISFTELYLFAGA